MAAIRKKLFIPSWRLPPALSHPHWVELFSSRSPMIFLLSNPEDTSWYHLDASSHRISHSWLLPEMSWTPDFCDTPFSCSFSHPSGWSFSVYVIDYSSFAWPLTVGILHSLSQVFSSTYGAFIQLLPNASAELCAMGSVLIHPSAYLVSLLRPFIGIFNLTSPQSKSFLPKSILHSFLIFPILVNGTTITWSHLWFLSLSPLTNTVHLQALLVSFSNTHGLCQLTFPFTFTMLVQDTGQSWKNATHVGHLR